MSSDVRTDETPEVEAMLRAAAARTRAEQVFANHATQHLPVEDDAPIGWLHPACMVVYAFVLCVIGIAVLLFRYVTGA